MKSIVLAPLALACGMAAAQPAAIYRCGNTYSAQACEGGRPVAVDSREPSDQERGQAAAHARRDAKLADELQKERLELEARPAQVYVTPSKPAAKPEPYKSPEKKATRKLDVFTATSPAGKVGKPPGRKE